MPDLVDNLVDDLGDLRVIAVADILLFFNLE
jgi:hypothetical protein